MRSLLDCSLIVFVFAMFSQISLANTDLLGLSGLAEGASPSYGENVTVGMVENTGVNYITAIPNSSGKLKFSVNLAGSFEVEFKIFEYDCCSEPFDFFLTADEHKINITFRGPGTAVKLSADSQRGDGDTSAAFIRGQSNKFKLSINNNIAKLYINDVFSQKVTLTPDLTYTQILMGGIEPADSVSALSIGGNANVIEIGSYDEAFNAVKQTCINNPASCGIIVSDGGTPPSGNCMANYSLAGQLHVPCVSVPDAFGGTTVYDIKMNQQSGSFTFDLDMGSVKPK